MGEGGGVIGQSAISIKRALSIATTVKGILGISEFEKAVSGMKSSNKTDGGETARTISYLLNWMQENKDVLVFATANDVRDLESEQFRIGRFSYIHFVDLPSAEDRQDIFRVHLQKRALKPDDFDLDVLAQRSEQFSGAEIEGAVGDAVLEAFIDGNRAAATKDVITAIAQLTPTAEMMKPKIDEIREWAKNNIKGSRTAPTSVKRQTRPAQEFWKFKRRAIYRLRKRKNEQIYDFHRYGVQRPRMSAECALPNAVTERSKKARAVSLYGYQGDKRAETAQIVVRRKFIGSASNDLGFQKTDNGYVPVISEYDQRYMMQGKFLTTLRTNYNLKSAEKLARNLRGTLHKERIGSTIKIRIKY